MGFLMANVSLCSLLSLLFLESLNKSTRKSKMIHNIVHEFEKHETTHFHMEAADSRNRMFAVRGKTNYAE